MKHERLFTAVTFSRALPPARALRLIRREYLFALKKQEELPSRRLWWRESVYQLTRSAFPVQRRAIARRTVRNVAGFGIFASSLSLIIATPSPSNFRLTLLMWEMDPCTWLVARPISAACFRHGPSRSGPIRTFRCHFRDQPRPNSALNSPLARINTPRSLPGRSSRSFSRFSTSSHDNKNLVPPVPPLPRESEELGFDESPAVCTTRHKSEISAGNTSVGLFSD